jgi:hypothetical protein
MTKQLHEAIRWRITKDADGKETERELEVFVSTHASDFGYWIAIDEVDQHASSEEREWIYDPNCGCDRCAEHELAQRKRL